MRVIHAWITCRYHNYHTRMYCCYRACMHSYSYCECMRFWFSTCMHKHYSYLHVGNTIVVQACTAVIIHASTITMMYAFRIAIVNTCTYHKYNKCMHHKYNTRMDYMQREVCLGIHPSIILQEVCWGSMLAQWPTA